MKLIFLDLDGVLVTRRPGVMEDRLLHNLQGLVARTGAEIVLSSDWRRHPAARDEARRVLATVGLKIIGSTPCMSAFLAQRPTEIMQWKKEFCTRPNAEHVTHWVAIDDRALLDERHGQYLRGGRSSSLAGARGRHGGSSTAPAASSAGGSLFPVPAAARNSEHGPRGGGRLAPLGAPLSPGASSPWKAVPGGGQGQGVLQSAGSDERGRTRSNSAARAGPAPPAAGAGGARLRR
mmetsp:Transcript_119182/g.379934  ORF Transcript_119182/g.379934 Transcript_119182/m.379934 type:complete len:235 (+) Transcript_119182:147-851(+)